MSSWPAGETEGAAAAHKDGLKTTVAAPDKHFSPLHLRWSDWVTPRALINTQAICLSPQKYSSSPPSRTRCLHRLDTSNRHLEIITYCCFVFLFFSFQTLYTCSTSVRRIRPLDDTFQGWAAGLATAVSGERRLANHDHLTWYRKVGLRCR